MVLLCVFPYILYIATLASQGVAFGDDSVMKLEPSEMGLALTQKRTPINPLSLQPYEVTVKRPMSQNVPLDIESGGICLMDFSVPRTVRYKFLFFCKPLTLRYFVRTSQTD